MKQPCQRRCPRCLFNDRITQFMWEPWGLTDEGEKNFRFSCAECGYAKEGVWMNGGDPE